MRSRGFTLIEVLVVLVIIGVIVSLATIALGDNRGEQLEQEARRLSAILQLAADESVLSSTSVGVHFFDDGYAFVRRNQQEWMPITNDRQLRERELPAPLRLAFVAEGDRDADRRRRVGKRDAEQPQAVFVASGELEPGFELRLSHPDLRRYYLIVARPDGRFEFHAKD